MLHQLIHSKKAAFGGFARNISLVGIVSVLFLALILTYFGNFLLNQLFGTKILQIGQPLRFLILGASLMVAFMLLITKRASLDRMDIFTIILLGVGSGLLYYYLPAILPEIFKNSVINSVYTNPQSPVYLWNNATSTAISGIQSIIIP